jgi:hypothetical protein
MAQIKKFSEYFEQPQAQEKQEVKENTGKSIDISYLADMDIEKGMKSLYAKVSKDLTKSFAGKKVYFMGFKTNPGKQIKVEGIIESVEVMEYEDNASYITVTIEDDTTYGGVTEITIL